MFDQYSAGARKVIGLACEEANQAGVPVDTEHLLLGLLADANGTAAGVLTRLGVSAAAVRAELAQPRDDGREESFERRYQAMLGRLQQLRRDVADFATRRKRAEFQLNKLRKQSEKLTAQAARAQSMDRPDLARDVLDQRAEIERRIEELTTRRAELEAAEHDISRAARRLQATVESLRITKDIDVTSTLGQAEPLRRRLLQAIEDAEGRELPNQPDSGQPAG